jgi:hypothetical protein
MHHTSILLTSHQGLHLITTNCINKIYIRYFEKVEDLNIRLETVKLLEEIIRENLYQLGLGNDFLEVTSKHRQSKQNQTTWTTSNNKASPQKWEQLIE